MNALETVAVRQLFPDEELYYVVLCDDEFIFRVITPAEYATIKQIAVTPYDEEDLVTQTALVYPAEYNVIQGPAGVPKVLSRMILEASLLTDESRSERASLGQRYIEDVMSNAEAQIPILIKTAFTEYTFEQIEAWPVDKILKMFARALFALNLRGIDVSQYQITFEDLPQPSLEERAQKLLDQGIDPITTLYDEYKTSVDVVDFPFITGGHWDNEEINHAVQQQIYQSRQR